MSTERSAASGSSKAGGDDQVEDDQITLSESSDNLEPLYDQLLKLSFPDSVTAIEHCRVLCAQFGFTVKQEASTHRNIYVYCSREGQPDSQRNPRTNPPKRKRPSKRCDCRWRIILRECDGRWEFRKSLNPDAAIHNHELLRPGEIDRNWPKAVIDLIQQLAREEALTTANIRGRVQAAFPDLAWNERRFYNRLSEERQKIRHRDTVARARHLTELWSRLCMVSAGNEDLSGYVEAEMKKLLASMCEVVRMDPASLQPPSLQESSAAQEGSESGTGTGSGSGSGSGSGARQQSQHPVVDDFMYSYNPPLSGLGGPDNAPSGQQSQTNVDKGDMDRQRHTMYLAESSSRSQEQEHRHHQQVPPDTPLPEKNENMGRMWGEGSKKLQYEDS
ncbi:hypothetical protein BX666DRAFT_1874254 [Dichotomocladium elegans]|nr:hypothetical protein BX666DRAFT_1874254 [Dichotomocladium elegans]